MPLNDSFKKKEGKPNIVKLTDVPTPADLQHGMGQVQQTRTPMGYTWANGDDSRTLFLVRSSATGDVNWTLRAGLDFTSPVIWRYATTDAHMIHTLLKEETEKVVPTEIPVELRPGRSPSDKAVGAADANGAPADKTIQTSLSPPAPTESPPGEEGERDLVGTVFAGKYDVISKVGRGGMGTVYKVSQRPLDRIVALKILHSHLLSDPTSKKRFIHEAKATSTLRHPNLVHIYDYGDQSGKPFIVMDFLEGPTLQDILKAADALDMDSFKFIFEQCCRAIAHAHEKGVIHRDLKPSNIVLADAEQDSIVVKVVDFGLAKLMSKAELGESHQELTQSGNVVGSPYFMSPEQCRGDELDTRSDIYSLGCVMYTALTGVLPFVGKDVFQTLYKHIYEVAPRFAAVRPDLTIPVELERIIFKACERDRDRRYQTIEDLWTDLYAFFKSQNVASQSTPPLVLEEQLAEQSVQEQAPEDEFDYAEYSDYAPDEEPVSPSLERRAAVQNQSSDKNADALSASQLMLEAGIITRDDLTNALDVKNQLGGDTAAIMVANGTVDHYLFDAATRCKRLVQQDKLSRAHALMILGFCKRGSVDFTQAVNSLGWNIASESW